jgi:hypothetical protein
LIEIFEYLTIFLFTLKIKITKLFTLELTTTKWTR